MNQENKPTEENKPPVSQPRQQAPAPSLPQQQPRVNKPMEKDLNLNEYKNLSAKTIAELTAIQERGKKLYAKKKFYRKEPYPPQEARKKTKEELKAEELQRKKDIAEYKDTISYSSYYYDEEHEYRHVNLPKMISRWLPIPNRILSQKEWVALGVSQSRGWEHYMIYAPEPHILLFKRERDYLRKYNLDSRPVRLEDIKKEEEEQKIKVEEEEIKEPVTSEIEPVKPSMYRSSRLAAAAAAAAASKRTTNTDIKKSNP